MRAEGYLEVRMGWPVMLLVGLLLAGCNTGPPPGSPPPPRVWVAPGAAAPTNAVVRANAVIPTNAVVQTNIVQTPHYPEEWWKPVPKEGAPAWEILPQEAKPGEVILSKRNELGLLSNFAATPFTFHGKRYASIEGFWQMMKYPEGPTDPRATFAGVEWANTRDQVSQMVGFAAKRAGTLADTNMALMGIDWVTFEGRRFEYKPAVPGEHYRLIVEATWEKVRQNPGVQKVLLATEGLVLRPDHYQEPNAPAAWRYYDIMMEIRSSLLKARGSAGL